MTALPHAPLAEADARPPRPGWAKALGISHVVIATLSSLCLLGSMIWVIAAVAERPADPAAPAMPGMDSPRYIWFVMIDGLSGLVANGFTLASGLSLYNLRAWGARTWRWLAPAKIGRLVVVWGGFIVGVAPALAASMGRLVVPMIRQQGGIRPGAVPTAGEMGLIYAWMFLAMGLGMIVLGSIYPALTWWLVRRPEIRRALAEGPADPPAAPAAAPADGAAAGRP